MLNFKRCQLLTVVILNALLLCSCIESKDERKSNAIDYMKSEVISDDALIKSWNLLEAGQKLADEGKSVDEVLKLFPVGTVFKTNSESIVFFIEGSIAMFIDFPNIYHSAKNKPKRLGSVSNAPKLARLSSFSTTTSSLNMNVFADNTLVDVIGNKENDTKRQNKKALLLYPVQEEFAPDKLGIDTAFEYLKKNRNYKDNVNFLTDSLTIQDFENLGKYDIVHITTHGSPFCNLKKIILRNNKVVFEELRKEDFECEVYLTVEVTHKINIKNLLLLNEIVEAYNGEIIIGLEKIRIKPEFFANRYKSGLKNKIWILSVCQLGMNSNFVAAMEKIHKDGHVFYWQNSVYGENDFKALSEFYKNLIGKGLDARKSFEEIPLHLKANLKTENGYIINDSMIRKDALTKLMHLQTDNPKHGIEVIDMLNPENNNLLVLNDFYPLVGDFNDGDDETLTLKVKLIGYTKAEFIEKQMSISLEVDDENVLSNKSFLPDLAYEGVTVESLKEHEYGVIVTINDIKIPDVGTKEELTLKAILHLNDKHISIHKEIVSIVNKGIIATVKGQGARVKYIYDSKTKAVKMTTPKGPIYYDSIGFVYTNMGRKGWMKMANKGMSMRQFSFMPAGIRLKPKEIAEINQATSDLPQFINFAINFRMISFETNDAFTKTLVDCGKPVECNRFSNNKGVHALFSPSGQLLEFGFNRKMTISYEYGDFNVKLPEAKLFEMPILDFKKAQLEWGKRGIDINFN